MVFDIYRITSPRLSCYIQYVLFNYSAEETSPQLITSFANTNVCLGIVKEKELISGTNGIKQMHYKPGINSYLSGMYLQPHKFESGGMLDEICIDFTPLGYYHFFRFPIKTYVLGEDILTEGFGRDAKSLFESMFEIPDFQKRGRLIEEFLLTKIIDPKISFLEQCLYHIHNADGNLSLKGLGQQLQSSEKKVVRYFLQGFDLTPKDYIRIVRFRSALASLNTNRTDSLTSICYDSGYYDQSHFIKDFRFFTEKTPGQIVTTMVDVKQNVIIGVE